MPNSKDAKTALAVPKGCSDTYYKFDGSNGESNKKFMTTPLAVNEWYSYSKYYDFDKGTNIYSKTIKPEGKIKVDQEAGYFKDQLWRGYAKVSYAVRAPWVVGRVCLPTSAVTCGTKTAVDNVENVNPVCISGGYNKCYNKMALNYHNEQRSLRKGTKNLELDTGIAKYIQ